VHSDTAKAATQNMTKDAHLKMVSKTGGTKNKMHHAVRCKYMYIEHNGSQLTVQRTAGIHRELCDQFITTCNGKSPWLTNTFVHTVHPVVYYPVVSNRILAGKFPDKHPHEWTKQALNTLGEAAEAYIVEVIAKSHC